MNKENNNSFNFKNLPWGWILLGITLWFLFPWIYSVLFDFIIRNPESYGSRFGAVGDIYGSLNAFVSSAALCAVAYSTWLQVTSLKETREANKTQLQWSEDAHKEQIKESQSAIFANKFYSLLNYKREKFNSISLECKYPVFDNGHRVINALTVMQLLTTEFVTNLDHNPHYYDNYNGNDIAREFMEKSKKLFNGPISPIISHFYIYKNLIALIQNSSLDSSDQAYYLDVMCNSMFQEEQMVLFWITPGFNDLKRSIDNSRIFNQIWYDESLKFYGLKFHQKDSFRIVKWRETFEDLVQK